MLVRWICCISFLMGVEKLVMESVLEVSVVYLCCAGVVILTVYIRTKSIQKAFYLKALSWINVWNICYF